MKMHPELDLSKARVDTLAQAKVATAPYGSWTSRGGPSMADGIQKTRDSKFLGIQDSGNCVDMLPRLYQATFGKSSSLIRFLSGSLGPIYHQNASLIFEQLPDSRSIPVSDNESPVFMSKFSLDSNKKICNDNKSVKGVLQISSRWASTKVCRKSSFFFLGYK